MQTFTEGAIKNGQTQLEGEETLERENTTYLETYESRYFKRFGGGGDTMKPG